MRMRADREDLKLCIFPLFVWFLISDETFSKFDCCKFSVDGQKEHENILSSGKSVGDFNEYLKMNSDIIFNCKKRPSSFDESASKTFARAGVNRSVHRINFKRRPSEFLITPTLTLGMLDEEVYRKELSSEVMRKRAMKDQTLNLPSTSVSPTKNGVRGRQPGGRYSTSGILASSSAQTEGGSTRSNDSLGSLMDDESLIMKRSGPSESVEERLSDLKNIIEARQRVIDENDNLYHIEKFVKHKKKSIQAKQERIKKLGISQSAPSLPITTAPEIEGTKDESEEGIEVLKADNIPKNIKYAVQLSANNPDNPYIIQRALSVQQYDMLNSISNLQTLRAMKSTVTSKKSAKSQHIAPSSVSVDNLQDKKKSSVTKEGTYSLSSKLDVLEELLQSNQAR